MQKKNRLITTPAPKNKQAAITYIILLSKRIFFLYLVLQIFCILSRVYMRMEGQEKLRQISAHIYAGHAGADKKKVKINASLHSRQSR